MERITCLLARLKIAHKLILSGVFFTLPVAVLLFYVTKEYNQGIRTCEREVAGTETLEVCPVLIHDLRTLAAQENLVSRSAPTTPDDMAVVRQRVAHAVMVLQSARGASSRKLAVRLNSLWRQVQERGPEMPAAEQTSTFFQMGEITTQLVPAILDDSSLILDSQLRTYHLMNIAGPLLLQAQASVAKVGAMALKARAEGRSLSPDDLTQLHAQNGMLLDVIIPRMKYSMEVSLSEDKLRHASGSSFQKNVPPLLDRYMERISDLLLPARSSDGQAVSALTPERIASAAAAAESAGVSLGSTAVSELRTLLISRINDDKRARFAVWLMSLFCVALAASVLALVTLNITRPLNFVVGLATDIATGKVREAFTRHQRGEFQRFLLQNGNQSRVQTKDEICELIVAVSAMTEGLNTLLAKVAQAGNQVASSTAHMAAAVRQIEAAVSEQAASANQVSVTSKEINVTAQDLARTMAGVTHRVGESAETARRGVRSLEGIRGAIDELISASTAMTRTFTAINQKTGNIDKVITAITKIANRTNLLSLNAAIEAEKSGDRAGGFSVVALEIRRLANQTAVAGLDIEEQIRGVQQAVREGVSSVEAYALQTQGKSAAVTELSSGLELVIEGTTKLAPEFEAVNKGMQMQSQGAGQIAEAMLHLRDAAAQTKDSLTQFRQVAEDLQSAVRDLQTEVGRFTTAS